MARKDSPKGAQFLRYFGPVLDALRSLGGSGTPNEVVERVARDLKVPDSVQNELLASGEPRFRNQVAWARLYLVFEGLVDKSRRGIWTLTERGWNARLDAAGAAEVFRKWVKIHSEQRKSRPSSEPETSRPTDETVSEGDHRSLVLATMQDLPANGFERLCQRILREAGFEEVVVPGR